MGHGQCFLPVGSREIVSPEIRDMKSHFSNAGRAEGEAKTWNVNAECEQTPTMGHGHAPCWPRLEGPNQFRACPIQADAQRERKEDSPTFFLRPSFSDLLSPTFFL